ncbi:MAG: hypothetical protein J5955_00520 [Bacilli bacterium]|nr:hypothetical protein [Bacilli bacterium]
MNKEIQFLIERSIIINLYFNHKIDFIVFTNALKILDEKYKDISSVSQLAITM